ncbi:MAG: winged helix-turn-helix transcriptional regulator [Peptococcaceae bacterium]|nr:winged helix-turn-helix transcriptional regulator [Peptococcaceae bacterium]
MLESLITSQTRIKLLLKFFLNPESKSYLRELAEEFGESTNSVRLELNRLTQAGLLTSTENGRTKVYQANPHHPLFPEIQSMVRKFTGIDQLIPEILAKLGEIHSAFITGDYAQGIDSGIIDLVVVGKVNEIYLKSLIDKVEPFIHRKIRFLVLSDGELENLKNTLKIEEAIPLWGKDGSE